MITVAQFKARYPEFDSVAEPTVQLFLDDTVAMIDETRWGDLYDRGTAALAAHYLALSIAQSSSGGSSAVFPISSKKVGDVQINYAVPASSGSSGEDYYNKTIYGQDYWSMVKLVGIGAVAVSDVTVIE